MATNPYSLRNVNLSYNNLNINARKRDKESTESEDCIEFVN